MYVVVLCEVIIAGDSRGITLGPYNIAWSRQKLLLDRMGFEPRKHGNMNLMFNMNEHFAQKSQFQHSERQRSVEWICDYNNIYTT